MRSVWPDVVVTDDSLVQCVMALRRVLKDDDHRLVQTEPKRGYRLVPTAAPRTPANGVTEPADFKQDIRFATTVDGARIAYALSGAGPTLVRVAHWMTHVDLDWQSPVYGPWIQGFSRRYRHVRYDGRGFGLSDRNWEVTCVDDEAHDLEAVVDSAGLDRFALFGRSQGGAISVRYAAKHPERVTHLVLLGAFARGRLQRGNLSEAVDQADALASILEAGWGQSNPAFRQLLSTMMFPGANAEQIASFNELQRACFSPLAAANLHRVLCHYDVVADLAHIECPTLVVHCPDDGLCAFEERRMLASKIPGARLETFGGSNHTPLPTDPTFEPVNRLIDEFLLGAPKLRTVKASPASSVVEFSAGANVAPRTMDSRSG